MLAIAINLALGRPPPTEFYLWSLIEIFHSGRRLYQAPPAWSIAGLVRLGRARIVTYQLLLPLYWAAMGVASFRAAYELIAKPYYWSKTGHGVSPMSHPPGGLVRRPQGTGEIRKSRRRPRRGPGAGEGNRTLVVSLGSFCSTIGATPATP